MENRARSLAQNPRQQVREEETRDHVRVQSCLSIYPSQLVRRFPLPSWALVHEASIVKSIAISAALGISSQFGSSSSFQQSFILQNGFSSTHKSARKERIENNHHKIPKHPNFFNMATRRRRSIKITCNTCPTSHTRLNKQERTNGYGFHEYGRSINN